LRNTFAKFSRKSISLVLEGGDHPETTRGQTWLEPRPCAMVRRPSPSELALRRSLNAYTQTSFDEGAEAGGLGDQDPRRNFLVTSLRAWVVEERDIDRDIPARCADGGVGKDRGDGEVACAVVCW